MPDFAGPFLRDVASRRRKQAAVVLVFGAMLVAGTLLGIPLFFPGGPLPGFAEPVAVADSKDVYLVGNPSPSEEGRPSFITVSSSDGGNWTQPVSRTGFVTGATAIDGWLYCVVSSGNRSTPAVINAYHLDDQWKVLPPLAWEVLSVGKRQNTLWCFGIVSPEKPVPSSAGAESSSESSTAIPPLSPEKPPPSSSSAEQSAKPLLIYSARFESDHWQAGPTVEAPDGVPTAFYLVNQSDGDYLYWQSVSASGTVGLVSLFGPTPGNPIPKLYRASFDGNVFGPVQSFDLGGPQLCVPLAEPDRTVVLAQSVEVGPASFRLLPPVHRFEFRDGVLENTPDVEIEGFRKASLVPGYFTAVRFADKTWLLVPCSYYGKFLAGVECFQLEDSHAVGGHWVMKVTRDQVQSMILWVAGAVFGLCLLGAGAVGLGYSFLPRTETRAQEPRGLATILERAVAAAIDVTLVGFIPWFWLGQLMNQPLPPLQTVLVCLVALLVYWTVMEAKTGQSIGKRITGLQVISVEGGPPSLRQSFLRNLVKLVELFTFGVIFVLGTPRYQRLGDLLAGTVVMSQLGMHKGDSRPNREEPQDISGD